MGGTGITHRFLSGTPRGVEARRTAHVPPWPLGVIALWLVGFAVLSAIVTGSCALGIWHLSSRYSTHLNHQEMAFAVTASSYALCSALTFAFILHQLRKSSHSLRDLWGPPALRLRHIALGFAAGALLMGMQAWLHALSAGFPTSPPYAMRIGWPLALVIELLVNAVFIGCTEEVLFRGAVFRALQGRFSDGPAVVLSTALFALFHFDYAHSLPAMTYVVALGVSTALLLVHTHSLNASVALHAAGNAAERLIYYAPHALTPT